MADGSLWEGLQQAPVKVEPRLWEGLIDPYSGMGTPSDAAQGRFNQLANSVAGGIRHLFATPGDVAAGKYTVTPEVPGQWSEGDEFRQQHAQGQLADWAAGTALGMIGTPGTPAGAVGSGTARMGRGGNWNPLDNAEQYKILAREAAERGGSTVRVFDTQEAIDRATGRAGLPEWRRKFEEVRHGWKSAKEGAVADYKETTMPHPLAQDPWFDPLSEPTSLQELYAKYARHPVFGAGSNDPAGLVFTGRGDQR